jgi:hypothetical protein
MNEADPCQVAVFITGLQMSDRIKVGDVYLELPKGAFSRPIPVAEKSDSPATLDPVAFTPHTPDLVEQYRVRPIVTGQPENATPVPEPELSQMAEWLAFTGAKSKIPQQWLNFVEGKQKHCGFNYWACFFGFKWFLFNKLYGVALLLIAIDFTFINVLFEFATYFKNSPEYPGSGVAIAFFILLIGIGAPRAFFASKANIWLLKKAALEIKEIRAMKVDNQRKLSMIASAGAPSFVALLLVMGMLGLMQRSIS